MSEPCPICGKAAGCRTYPLMLERFAAGRDVDHWRRIHDQINGAPSPSPPTIPRNIPDRPDPNSGVRLGGCCGG